MRRIGWVLAILSCFAPLCFGQSVTGTLLGTVSDVSGVLPGAKVTITNVDTNVSRETTTNRAGIYQVSNLQAGHYRIHVEKSGYTSIDVQNVALLLNQVVRNDVSLRPGTVQQMVQVSAAPPVVQTETSSVSTVLDTHSLETLPTNGRTLDPFILTAPGNTGEDSASNPKIAGSEHWGGTSFTVNGVSYNDLGNGGGAYSYQTSLTTQPSLDAIDEVKIESNNAPAESPASVAVSIITRGGGNQFHGSLFEFNRNTAVAANDYFANAAGVPRPPYNRNEFGGSIGGPIWKNRTFFFFSGEGWTQRTSRTGTFSVPTADERAGCFTQRIKDPDNGGKPFPSSASCPNGYQIPTNRLDPRTLAVLKFVPLPNKPGLTRNLVQTLPSRINLARYTGRVDHHFNPSNSLTLIGNYSKGGPPYEVNLYSPIQYGNYSNAGYETRSADLTYTRIIGATMTNELRLSYFDHWSVRQGQNHNFDPSTLFPGLFPHIVGGLPTFSISGLTSIADRGGSLPQPEITEQIGDTFAWSKGAHQIKAGFDLAYNRVKTNSSVSPSTLGFFYFGAYRYTGAPLANALLGYPNDAVRSMQTPATNIGLNRYSAYVQDSWRIFPRLTLNLGLRYELQTEPVEKFGTWANFDFDNGINVVRTVKGQLPPTVDPTQLSLYPYAKSEDVGWGSNVLVPDRKNFAPRFGFAFRPKNDNSMVVSGGFGIYYNMPPIYQGIYQLGISNPPFRLTQEYDSNPLTPTVTLANPFAVTPKVTANPVLYAVDRHMHNTYSEQWNMTFENRLPGDIGFRLSYLGNKVVHAVYINYNMNLPRVQGPGDLQSLRPYQPYADIDTMHFAGDSFTNQMQAVAIKRYSNGTFFQTSLNWTKSIDDVPEVGSPQNPYDPKGDRGVADGVRTITYYFGGGWDLPFGPGRRYLNGRGPVGKVLQGWSVSAIAQALSGAPFTPSFDSSGAGWYATRPNVVPGVSPYVANKNIQHWLNPAAFSVPTIYTFGNSRRNSLFGPKQESIDFDVSKVTSITERVRVQFRADAFNLTNTANFTNPSSDITVPSTYGTINSTNVAVPARVLQFGLKMLF